MEIDHLRAPQDRAIARRHPAADWHRARGRPPAGQQPATQDVPAADEEPNRGPAAQEERQGCVLPADGAAEGCVRELSRQRGSGGDSDEWGGVWVWEWHEEGRVLLCEGGGWEEVEGYGVSVSGCDCE